MSAGEFFTAEEIGRALGKTRHAIRRALKDVNADGSKIACNNVADAWSFERLPTKLRAELLDVQRRHNFSSVVELLVNPPERYEPSIPLAQVDEKALTKARKLRDALTASLNRRNDLSISAEEAARRGCEEYQTAFGHKLSVKQWRRLLDRTVARDAGAEQWHRLELYLDENCGRRKAMDTEAVEILNDDHEPLKALIASFGRPAEPTKAERVLLWQTVFDRYSDLITEGKDTRKVRRSLVAFLAQHAPSLAKSAHAMHQAFNAKFEKWQAAGGKPSALKDRREEANKVRALVIGEKDQKTLLAFAARFGGSLSQGWREALRMDALSAELVGRYISNPSSKSYVPHPIRDALRHDIKLVSDPVHGPRQTKLGGAFIERDPDTFASGDWMQGDDCTLPNLYYEETAQGVRLMRGQFLAMIDVRTTFILGFVLISAPPDRPSTYNSGHIRNLITTVHELYGLPRCGFYFENGTWRSHALTGNAADWTGTEAGLREFGLRFRHARLPRAKVVERVFKSLQNLMGAEPGYVGRGWHNDRYERVEQRKRQVEAGKAEASEHFYNRDEWVERLTYLVQRYNEDTNEGKYCGGLSPKDAYEKYFGAEPLTRLPDAARYLLANERKLLKVGRNGIGFRIGAETFSYKSEDTGALIGRSVEVYFNRDLPEIVGVKQPDTGEMFAVRRATIVPAMDAAPETLAQAFAENEAHDSYKRALYRAIVPKFSEHFLGRPIFRPTVVDRATVEAGRQLAARVDEEKTAASNEKRLRRRTVTAAAQIGMVPPLARDPETQAKASEEVLRLVKKAKAQQT